MTAFGYGQRMDDSAHGLRVNIDQLIYQEGILTPPDTPHCFAYYITIMNEGEETIAVRGRKWVVTEVSGQVTAVEGDGVVGEFPVLGPGEHFSYNSYHMLRSSRAIAQGSYLGVNEAGEPVVVGIPSFEMVVPGAENDGYC